MARRHGCERPFNIPQIVCVILYFFLLGGFYALASPAFLEKWETAVVTSLYTIAVLAAAVLFLYTSCTDPSEYGTEVKDDEDQYYCVLCQVHVKKQSKHCRSCDRCVDGFDHHCKWLNNCVGAKNYWSFFLLVSVTCVMICIQFASGVYLFVISFTQKDVVRAHLYSVYGDGLSLTSFRVLQVFYCVLDIAPAILLGELLFFHILLQYKGMSTYDYIMAQREAKAQAQAELEAGNVEKKKFWQLKIFSAGGVSTDTRSSARVRVGINPLALLKMKGSDGSGLACGCRSNGKKSAIHPLSFPGTLDSSPASPMLDLSSEGKKKALAFGEPAAEGTEATQPSPLTIQSEVPPSLHLSKLAVLPPFTSRKSTSLTPTLPPIRPPKSKPGFH
mmetsp:Transcript_18789/g.52353  ORF Transcript_18789/g.52353 Transcript_18789/m.52353 type:complete len:388 (+) Transcript_18789:538-1701(+)|eukprot:CAMPEP_0117664530 /NCGR_PEP_ID=MMETSP0804-20121206/9277_1 /TAXON_ID=1074897 /ORGANISM="Tetraselmis astigmatica, Strain CCMP880" /LENGTH=387 /DNA_ID=CAMNT_0005471785 /DNA_START=463 /DNA_END=1626 /DNA_ORIENTATION=+